jgi:hypothetical protein
MGTEVLGTLTHADAPHSAPRHVCVCLALHLKLFFAGASHAGQIRVREQIRMTLKTPLHGKLARAIVNSINIVV